MPPLWAASFYLWGRVFLTSGMSWAFSMRTILTVSPPHWVRVSPWVGSGSGCISLSAMLSWARSRDCKTACLQENNFKHTSCKLLICHEIEGVYLGQFILLVRCWCVPVSTWMCVSDSRLWSSSPSLFWLCWMIFLTWNHHHTSSSVTTQETFCNINQLSEKKYFQQYNCAAWRGFTTCISMKTPTMTDFILEKFF